MSPEATYQDSVDLNLCAAYDANVENAVSCRKGRTNDLSNVGNLRGGQHSVVPAA